MALYVIGDLHLSEHVEKPMDIFGGIWTGYRDKIVENWQSTVKKNDTVVICGDISWGINLDEALLDLKLINSLNGKKIILKGNHDLWWSTLKKMNTFLKENDIDSISFLHNNCYFYDDIAICGSRGWTYEDTDVDDEKIWCRELLRIEASFKEAKKSVQMCEIYCFLHYPPLKTNVEMTQVQEIFKQYAVKRCFYGHLHGASLQRAITGDRDGTDYRVVSADYLNFKPVLIKK